LLSVCWCAGKPVSIAPFPATATKHIEERALMMGYLIYFGLPVVLLILGFPIFLILLVTSIVAVLTIADVPTEAIQTYMFGSLDNFPLLAVPFFVLAGEIMAQGGIARRVIAMVMAMVGRGFGTVRCDVAYRRRHGGGDGTHALSGIA
jgi:TRAP-type mannitol/chloroaromatic compound transport system permease large subunit